MSKFSKVILTVAEGTDIKQECSEPIYINTYKPTEHPAIAFNKTINEDSTRGDIYGFLGPNDSFNSLGAITHILQAFNEYSEIECVYADNVVVQESIITTNYYPIYNFKMCDTHVINTPIFMKLNLKPKFNEKLKCLYFFDIIQQLSKQILMWHIPYILFRNVIKNPHDLQHDLTLLKFNG